MGLKQTLNMVGVGVMLSIVTVNYSNCAKSNAQKAEQPSVEKMLGLPAINYFREPVPDRFCGIEGYGFLLRSYLGPECGTCHTMVGMYPPFADGDLGKAYSYGRALGKDNFLEKVLDNRFCGPDCNLDKRGEIYQALAEWLDHPDNCN
jgi:hypothetical protein